jgi:4-aminobutyrate aminotransferase-like enzyme
LGGGMPVSACMGRADVMGAWGEPAGEALHTGTFFGHPLGCSAALAVLEVIAEEGLVERAREGEAVLLEALSKVARRHGRVREVRAVGLLAGVELDEAGATLAVVQGLLQRGWIALPAGGDGRVVQVSPPLVMQRPLLVGFAEALDAVLGELGAA